ncbi:DUF5801 repeats-in-toxin domain-containing protein [Dongia sp.]|uniref:DUF5801 repeats-in-toxin domain-containing protein n=1 Tax=Dongia sp. TaxID=1977262 RepID=UPI0035ADBCE7
MATDTTNLTTESAGTVHEGDVSQSQLTQSNAAPVQVQVPAGENVVRVQVTPGETVQLPFPIDAVVARLGENGNLAVKVGDVTVILLGYAEATGQAEVTIIGTDARPMDVAAVLAATDPNLDIQTAAGPGAGDAGAGVDNNGGLFSPFDPLAGIGGLNAVGGLNPTALNYNLIQNEYREIIENDTVADNSPTILQIDPVLINEDDFIGGEYNDYSREQSFGFGGGGHNGNDQYDSDDNDQDGASGPTDGTGNNDDSDKEPTAKIIGITVDFHGEVPGDLKLLDSNLPSDWKSDGMPITWSLSLDGHTLIGSANGMNVVVVEVLNAPSMDGNFQVLVELLAPLDHPNTGESPNVQDLLTANIGFEVIDSNGSTAQATFPATFEDDVPFDAQVGYYQESESNPGQGHIDEDALKGGVQGDGENGDDDGSSYVEGHISVAFGGDGPANVDPFKFSVPVGEPTGLFTATGDVILWGVDGNQRVFGYVAGNENDHIFEAVIYDSGYFEFWLNQPLQHDGHENPNDENATGYEDNLVISIPVIATDNDGDTLTTGIAINVDDDMPKITTIGTDEGTSLFLLTSDETVGGADNYDVPGGGSTVENDEKFVTEPAALAGNYGNVIGGSSGSLTNVFSYQAGADGEKSHEYGLDIINAQTNITDTLTGLPVTLVEGPGDGVVRGVVNDNGTELTVFALVVDDQTGDITFVQYRAVDHGSDGSNSYPDEVTYLADGHLAATLSVTDKDGDTVTASSDLGNKILFEDDGPAVGDLGTVYFDDDLLPGGNPGGTDDDAPNAGDLLLDNDGHPYIEGTFPVDFGSDGPESTKLQFVSFFPIEGMSFGSGVATISGTGSPLEVRLDGVLILRVEIVDQDAGTYRITQFAPVPHTGGGDENDATFQFAVKFTDGDGDFVVKTMTIQFDDDTPTIGLKDVATPDLVVDETDLTADATASFAGLFNTSAGADGQKGDIAYVLGVKSAGAESGLIDIATGNKVYLFLEGGVVVGREGTDAMDAETGEIVFTVTVAANGDVTLDQQRAVQHDDPNDPDESTSPATLSSSDLITLTATITDKDNDTASVPANIGSALKFEDDGPSVQLKDVSAPSLTVDETDLTTNDTKSFAGLFQGSGGTDGQKGDITYALGVKDTGALSGLVDIATGHAVFLFIESGKVVGREGTDATDAASGDIVFTVSVDGSGNVTLDQARAVEHDDPLDPDEATSPAHLSAADLITLTATITDKDDDTASVPANIGLAFNFRDDGPTVVEVIYSDYEDPNHLYQGNLIDEDDLTGPFVKYQGNGDNAPGDDDVNPNGLQTTARVEGFVGVDFGADGPAATDSFKFDVVQDADTGLKNSEGKTIYWNIVDPQHIEGVIDGQTDPVFTVELQLSPIPGYFLFQLNEGLYHPGHDDPSTTDVTETAYEDNLDIYIPVIATDKDGDHVSTDIHVIVDDDMAIARNDYDSVANLLTTDGNVITGVGTSDPANGSDKLGADNGTVTGIASVEVPGNTSTPVTDQVHGNGFEIDGEFGTLTIYEDGYYTYTRFDGVPLIEDDHFTYTLTDGDGDATNAVLTINIYDEGTDLDTNPDGENDNDVDEKGMPVRNGEPAGTGEAADGNGSDDDDTSEKALGQLVFNTPDGFGSLTIEDKDGNAIAIASVGQIIHGKYGDLEVTAFDSAAGTMSYTYKLLDNVDHSNGAVKDELKVVVTDSDGDHSNGTISIDIIDDAPIASNDFGGSVNTGSSINMTNPANGVLANDLFGADGAKSGGGLIGVVAGNGNTQSTTGINSSVVSALGTLVLHADGTYTYTPKANANGTDYFTYTIEDGDGDRTTAVLSFTVTDPATGTFDPIVAWTYEDGQPNQHTGDTATSFAGLPNASGINFAGAFHPSDNEVITQITFGVPAGVTLVFWDGTTATTKAVGPTTFVVAAADLSKVQFIAGPNVDGDQPITMDVAIKDNDSNLTNVLLGQSLTLKVDAVADKPTAVDITLTDSGGNGIFSVGEAGTINIKASFADGDGSETHTLVLKVPAGFNLTDWNGSSWAGLPANGVSVLSVTGSALAGWTVTFAVADATTSVNLDVHVTNTAAAASNAQFTVDAKSGEEATVAGPNGNGSGSEFTNTNNNAITSDSVGVVSARILNGQLVTNTPSAQQGDQAMILTFVQDGHPLNVYAQVVVRDTQGQQGAVLADSGFNINPSADFNVSLENALEGHKIIVTDFNLEGVTLDVSGGNIQIEHEDASNKPMGVYAQMSPNDGGTVIVTDSIDGTSGNNAAHNGTTGQDYLYGGAGNDTLNGGNEDDVLNGGIGNDILNGDAGNDVLVWNGGLQTDANNPALGDTYHGGADFDLLRIDQGALYNSTIGGKTSIDFFPDQASDATVDLRGAHIDGIEGILITEEAVISGSGQSGSDALGTKVLINAKDVFDFSDNDTIYVIGSKGDTVDIDNATGVNQGATNWVKGGDITPEAGGVTFTQWTGTFTDNGGTHNVTLYVDKDVQVV